MSHWRPDISLGNILTIITLIVGVALGYQQIASAIAHQGELIDKLEVKVNTQLTDTQNLNRMRGDDRLEVTRILVEMQTDMRYLRTQVEALTRAQQRAAAPVERP